MIRNRWIFALMLIVLVAPAWPQDTQSLDSPYASYIELRAYTMHPGKRDDFLEHFERHYLESQEFHGMRVWGQFRDLEQAQRFVWVRGYQSMEERLSGLMGFYTSSTWQSTSSSVHEMMAERATHIHFMEPLTDHSGFFESYPRPVTHSDSDNGVIVVRMYQAQALGDGLMEHIETVSSTRLQDMGGRTIGLFQSSLEENNFPALPVIEDENILAWFLSFPDLVSYRASLSLLDGVAVPFEHFVLEPGDRSRLVHHPLRH